jgi:DNA polymerase-3 subunit epsilon
MGLFSRFRKTKPPQAPWPTPGQTPSTTPAAPAPQRQPTRTSPASTPVRNPAPAPSPTVQPRFVVLDVETTGLSAKQHRVIEIAVITTDILGRVQEEWTTRLDPQGPVGATHIHGLSNADVAGAPVFAEIVNDLNRRLAGAAVAAHNAKFDLAFLREEYHRAGWTLPSVHALCTLQACDHHLPHLERRRLADCCWAIGQPLVDAHSALGDARATAALLAAFMHPHLGAPPTAEHLAMPQQAALTVWPIERSHAPGKASQQPGLTQTGRTGRPAPPPRVQRFLTETANTPPPPALVELIERFSLVDALDEGAPHGSLPYLEKLAEVLEDGVLDAQEAGDLAELAVIEELDSEAVAATNRAFVLALAHAALADGKVTRAERTELLHIAETLSVDANVVPHMLDRAEAARHARLSAGLGPLPDPWPHGQPLRVGDKVVFTGCDDRQRSELEAKSEELGVRVISGVSAKTAFLVTDGTMDGTKAAKARQLGTVVVHPDQYTVLLTHLQPSSRPPPGARPPLRAEVGQPGPPTELAPHQDLPTAAATASPAVVRQWAREHGWEVGVRGRLPKQLLDAYAAATRPRG